MVHRFSSLMKLGLETTMGLITLTFVVISISAAACSVSLEHKADPPPVFWQWNTRYLNRGRSSEEAPTEENYPEFIQSYFDSSNLEKSATIMGSYVRETPERWFGQQSSKSIEDGSPAILVLGKRLKLSHGPRKKRSQLEISSYNDDLQNLKTESPLPIVPSDAEVSEIVYIDPLFKIPVVQRVAASPTRSKIPPTPTSTSATIPMSMMTPKSSVKSQRRCDPLSGDCLDEVQEVLSVGPFVQTRLECIVMF